MKYHRPIHRYGTHNTGPTLKRLVYVGLVWEKRTETWDIDIEDPSPNAPNPPKGSDGYTDKALSEVIRAFRDHGIRAVGRHLGSPPS